MTLLQKRIQEASQKYYTDGSSDLSDAEFDALLEEERKLNPDSPLLNVGHGYDITQDTTYGQKMKHKYGLVGSLDKCHNYKEISTSLKKSIESGEDIISSLKLDGLSCVAYYIDGELAYALTRGDGTTGVDITEKVKYIFNKQGKGVHIDPIFTGAVRGELIMSEGNFEKFHKLHPESKNPRNSTAGLINGKEITSDFDFLNLVVYTVIGIQQTLFKSYSDIITFLKHNFAEVVPVDHTNKSNISETGIESYMNNLHDKWYGNYPADGIVLAADTIQIDNEYVVYNSMAYKFPTPIEETTVTDIVWELSRTGYLIPRIQFEPVEIEGSTIQYCAGHNAENIKNIHVGIGSRIKVTKANSIIPYLVSVESEVEYELPTKCPSCGNKLYWNGVHLQCQNNKCKNSDIQDTLIWFDAIAPADGLGDTLKLKFLSEMLGEDKISIENIYAHGAILTTHSDQVKLTLFMKTFNRLFTDKVSVYKAIQALNIPRMGDITCKKLDDPKYSKDIQALVEGKDPSDSLRSIGDANFKSIMNNKDKFKRLRFLKDRILYASSDTPKISTEVKDVVITGKLEGYSRKSFAELLAAHGYNVTETLNEKTSFLITNDPNSNSSKNQKADKLNITKITQKDFIDKFINNTQETTAEPKSKTEPIIEQCTLGEPTYIADNPQSFDMYIIHPELCSQKQITVTVGKNQDAEVPYVVVHRNTEAGPKYLCCIRLDNGLYYDEVENSPIDPYIDDFWDIMMSGWDLMKVLLQMMLSRSTYRTATGYESAVKLWCNFFRPGTSIHDTKLFNQTPEGVLIAPDFDQLLKK